MLLGILIITLLLKLAVTLKSPYFIPFNFLHMLNTEHRKNYYKNNAILFNHTLTGSHIPSFSID